MNTSEMYLELTVGEAPTQKSSGSHFVFEMIQWETRGLQVVSDLWLTLSFYDFFQSKIVQNPI